MSVLNLHYNTTMSICCSFHWYSSANHCSVTFDMLTSKQFKLTGQVPKLLDICLWWQISHKDLKVSGGKLILSDLVTFFLGETRQQHDLTTVMHISNSINLSHIQDFWYCSCDFTNIVKQMSFCFFEGHRQVYICCYTVCRVSVITWQRTNYGWRKWYTTIGRNAYSTYSRLPGLLAHKEKWNNWW